MHFFALISTQEFFTIKVAYFSLIASARCFDETLPAKFLDSLLFILRKCVVMAAEKALVFGKFSRLLNRQNRVYLSHFNDDD